MIGSANDTEHKFDFIMFLVALSTGGKKTKVNTGTKKSSPLRTTDQIHMKFHKKNQCDMGSKRYGTDF